MYYHSQIPGLSEDFGDQIDYLVRGMMENFEEENPYLVSFIFQFNPLYTYKFFHLVLAICTYQRAQIIISKLRCYLVPEDWLRLLSISKVVVLLLLICYLLLLSFMRGFCI